MMTVVLFSAALLAVCFTAVSCMAYCSTLHIPPARRSTFNGLQGVISQKIRPRLSIHVVRGAVSYHARRILTCWRNLLRAACLGYRMETVDSSKLW
jgi:hypothetical protein